MMLIIPCDISRTLTSTLKETIGARGLPNDSPTNIYHFIYKALSNVSNDSANHHLFVNC